MQIEMTQQVTDFVNQTQQIQGQERDMLIWAILQNSLNKTSSVQEVKINDTYGFFYFPQFLFSQQKKEDSIINKRKPGSLENMILYMSPDFDEPLSDFNEYM